MDRAFWSFLSPNLFIPRDLGLDKLTAEQFAGLRELLLNRYRISSFIITSNWGVDEWFVVFDNPILGTSTLDGLDNASYPENLPLPGSCWEMGEAIEPLTKT